MAYVERSRDEIIKKLEEWGEKHPLPDDPSIFIGKTGYSPRQIVVAVQTGVPENIAGIIDYVIDMSRKFSIDPLEVIQRAIVNNNLARRDIRD